ncbi:MAG: ABC transporter permease [Negativicutes bacterium]
MSWFALFWQHIKTISLKELLVTFNDPVDRRMLMIPVFIQGFLFGYSATFNLDSAPYALLDLSHSAPSTELIAHFDASSALERARLLQNQSEIADAIDSGDAMLVIVFPADFAEKLARGETSPLQLIADGRNTMTAGLATGYVSRIVAAWNAARAAPPVELLTRTWYNPNQETRWNFLPGLIGMISFTQVVMLAGLSVARERELGTFDQLLVTPLSPTEILIGKALPPTLIGIFQSTALFLIARFWFGVPFAGSLPLFYLTLLIFTVSSTGIGLIISSVADNMQQVLVYVFVLLLPLALLSGIVTPIHNMPEPLQYLTYADPMRFAIEAIRRIYLEGAGFSEIAPNFLPMLLVAAVTLPLAGWLFRHKTT